MLWARVATPAPRSTGALHPMFKSLLLLVVAASAAAGAVADSTIPANYELKVTRAGQTSTSRFVLVREEDRVEVQDLASGVVERWQRDAGGRLFYLRIFKADRKAIEFQPADLAMAGVTDRWDLVRSVVSPALRDELQYRGQRRFRGRTAESFRGTRDDLTTELLWLADLEVPARVVRKRDGERSTLELTALEHGLAAAQRFLPRDELQQYEHIDFADLGDRHGDPFVQRVEQQGRLVLHEH
jgi:hypothetical protein